MILKSARRNKQKSLNCSRSSLLMILQLEEVRQKNKTMFDQIKDIMDQITDGGLEIDKILKRLERWSSSLLMRRQRPPWRGARS